MRGSSILAFVVTLFAYRVQSHYIFYQLTVDGKKGEVYQHIRQNTNVNSPVIDLDSHDLRCNVGCHDGTNTTTAIVEAGSVITWIADVKVYHQGPLSVYMTKVPNVTEADGSTKWFKIMDIGPSFSPKGGNWEAIQQQEFDVQIPKCIPAGEYLMRIQQLGIHVPGKLPQFYVSCAHLKVDGGGSDLPPTSHLVDIPGAFNRADPGFNVNIFKNFQSYKIPGPPLWTC